MSDNRPAPPDPPPYRLSDAERDEAIGALGDAFAEGRLDAGEFTARMQAASEATFATDLDPLFADLPSRRVRSRAVAPRPASRPRQLRRGPARFPAFAVAMGVFLLVVTVGPWILLPALFLLTRHRRYAATAEWHRGRPSGCRRVGGHPGCGNGNHARRGGDQAEH